MRRPRPAGWILPVPQTRAALAPSTMAQALTQYGRQAGGNGAQEMIPRLDRQRRGGGNDYLELLIAEQDRRGPFQRTDDLAVDRDDVGKAGVAKVMTASFSTSLTRDRRSPRSTLLLGKISVRSKHVFARRPTAASRLFAGWRIRPERPLARQLCDVQRCPLAQ